MGVRAWVRYLRKSRETWSVVSEVMGWGKSFKNFRPLDRNGDPIPWYTYPAIEFVRGLKLDDCKVFEYGSGNSSIFWAGRVGEIIAVENDPAWADEVRARGVKNLRVITSKVREEYINLPLAFGGGFDIVIIDGRYRKECAEIAVGVVNNNGMIIFDNADWYPEACGIIRSNGWFQICFSGLGPINSYAWTTAVFIKSSNKFPLNQDFRPLGGNPDGAV